jgi:hypothetical protein
VIYTQFVVGFTQLGEVDELVHFGKLFGAFFYLSCQNFGKPLYECRVFAVQILDVSLVMFSGFHFVHLRRTRPCRWCPFFFVTVGQAVQGSDFATDQGRKIQNLITL